MEICQLSAGMIDPELTVSAQPWSAKARVLDDHET
jgi:hypothetical protein